LFYLSSVCVVFTAPCVFRAVNTACTYCTFMPLVEWHFLVSFSPQNQQTRAELKETLGGADTRRHLEPFCHGFARSHSRLSSSRHCSKLTTHPSNVQCK